MPRETLLDIDTLVQVLARLGACEDPRVKALLDFRASDVNDAWELRFDMQSLSNDLHEEAERQIAPSTIPATALVSALASAAE